ncbi:MAG TPA: hypothetical protein VL992_03200 [Tepidisphaeraceae bacterium]|nr:hypothetical protein [Tepidisphaeraceae bacterium]
MAIREKLSGSSVAGTGVAAALLIVSAMLLGYYHFTTNADHPDPFSKFYSDDDGRTYFRDSAFKFPPFDHGGKTAVGALVFDDGDKRFVGYLYRFSADAQQQLQNIYANPPAGETAAQAAMLLMQSPQIHNEMEIKKVGGSWMPSSQMGRPFIRASDGTAAIIVNP